MATAVQFPLRAPPPLTGPFDTRPSPDALKPTPVVVDLVRSQVQALLNSSPAYHEIDQRTQGSLEKKLVYIASYAAECMRDMCLRSRQLGQVPVLRQRESVTATAQAADFDTRAAGRVAKLTQEQLKAIAFPTFVADLIRGTFDAIVRTSIQQMEAFVEMIANVSKTVDQFMQDNITDNQAKDWLQSSYPGHIKVTDGKAVAADGADERTAPNFRHDLNLPEDVSLDDTTIEEVLVPAARRRLAEGRLQILSTLVLMGVNRIVVTGGKIRATMGFHIDTTDRAREEHATDFDFRHSAAGSFGYGPWSASASHSISYVRSTRGSSDAELNMDTDLTGEVELHFKTDHIPLTRFATGGVIGTIRNNTAVPEANTPADLPAGPLGSGVPAAGGEVTAYKSPRSRRSPAPAPTLPKIGTPLPEARKPVAPDKPKVERWEAAPGWEDAKAPEGAIVSKRKDEKPAEEGKKAEKPSEEGKKGEKPEEGTKTGKESPPPDKAAKKEAEPSGKPEPKKPAAEEPEGEGDESNTEEHIGSPVP